TGLRRHAGLDVISSTGQQPSTVAPDDDPIPPAEASRSDHGRSRYRVPCWMWAAERPASRTGAPRRGPRPLGSIVWGETRTGPPGRHRPEATCARSGYLAPGGERKPGTQKPSAGSSTAAIT